MTQRNKQEKKEGVGLAGVRPDSVVTKGENRKRPCGIPVENERAIFHRNTHTFSPFANTAPEKGDC
jgi:hypothetical protein